MPPLLAICTAPAALKFEGGPAQVGMLIDWREMASVPTYDWKPLTQLVTAYTSWGRNKATDLSQFTGDERRAIGLWAPGSVWLNVSDAHNGKPVPAAVAASSITWKEAGNSTSTSASEVAAPTGADVGGGSQEARMEQWEWKLTHDASRGWAITAGWALAIPFECVRIRPYSTDQQCAGALLPRAEADAYA